MSEMKAYVQSILDLVAAKDPNQVEYQNTVKEFLTTILPVLEKHPEYLILVDNAVKYTPDGGQVTLRLETAEGGRVRFSVQDTGIGIAKADQDRIFDRFYRVDKARSRAMGGNGLGLAIARNMALLSGVRLTLSNRSEGGLRARILFIR